MDKNELYEIYQPKAYAYLLSAVKNQHTAEDLCSNVFLKVCSKLDTYDSTKSAVSTWIFNITKNTLCDYYRTSHPTCELTDEVDVCVDLNEALEQEEELKALADALLQLNEFEQAVIIGKYYKNKTFQKIADELGVSLFRVWSTHQKSTEKMKKIMQKGKKTQNEIV